MDREPYLGSPNGLDRLLGRELLDRVLEAFGLGSEIRSDLAGLHAVYAAWCRAVPFDNMRKMIALRAGDGAKLPGLDPADFFENWLANGTGGTCWPSSNAMYALLRTLGFNARRVAGSMFDMGMVNHGTVKVNIDGQDWLCDTGLLTKKPLPLTDEVYIGDDPTVGVEVEPLHGSYMIWIDFVPLEDYVPCRLLVDPVDSSVYAERNEVFSRELSPFNQRLYFRKSGPGGASTILGNTHFSRSADGLQAREFSSEELCGYLENVAGVSPEMVGTWAGSGSLDSTFNPVNEMPRPEIHGKPPSRR